jgi:hypothetical protein
MAIYGVGSKWKDEELKEQFFSEEKFILGWNEKSAKDLYSFVAALKVGDILYIKANSPGARVIRVKGIGVVTRNLVGCINAGDYDASPISDWSSLFVRVAWVNKEDFSITIPDDEGKLTNIRAATMYEEYLPLVQDAILEKVINR